MRPFNLQEALAGKKVVTRDGDEVTQIKKFDCATETIAGVINGRVKTWWEDGLYLDKESDKSNMDLFMATEKKTVWVNAYKSESGKVSVGCAFDTKDDALMQTAIKHLDYFGTYSIEIEV